MSEVDYTKLNQLERYKLIMKQMLINDPNKTEKFTRLMIRQIEILEQHPEYIDKLHILHEEKVFEISSIKPIFVVELEEFE